MADLFSGPDLADFSAMATTIRAEADKMQAKINSVPAADQDHNACKAARRAHHAAKNALKELRDVRASNGDSYSNLP